MARETHTNTGTLSKVGNGVGAFFPKDMLRDYGLLDEDDQPDAEAEVKRYRDDERGVIGLEVPIDQDD